MRAVPLGFGVGIVSGMFGIGGGALIILGLLALGFTQHAAHATSLAAMILTAAAAAVPFAAQGAVSPAASALLAGGAVLGAFAGAGLMHRLSEDRLRRVFAVFILLVALRMLVGVDPGPVDAIPGMGLATYAGLAALGLGAGVLSSVLGVGGGLVVVPALVLAFGFSQHAAEGTSLIMIIPTALMGAYRHTKRGYTDWRVGGLLGVAGVAGGVAGAFVALSLGGSLLARLFGAFLAIMAVRLWRAGGSD